MARKWAKEYTNSMRSSGVAVGNVQAKWYVSHPTITYTNTTKSRTSAPYSLTLWISRQKTALHRLSSASLSASIFSFYPAQYHSALCMASAFWSWNKSGASLSTPRHGVIQMGGLHDQLMDKWTHGSDYDFWIVECVPEWGRRQDPEQQRVQFGFRKHLKDLTGGINGFIRSLRVVCYARDYLWSKGLLIRWEDDHHQYDEAVCWYSQAYPMVDEWASTPCPLHNTWRVIPDSLVVFRFLFTRSL